jgi:hypothetical protein
MQNARNENLRAFCILVQDSQIASLTPAQPCPQPIPIL